MKKIFFLLCLIFSLLYTSITMAQNPVRVKCGQFTMNVPTDRIQCYQIDDNIPVSAEAAPFEIAGAQIANTAIFFTDYSYKTTDIDPQVIFYKISDLEKTSFDLLDISLSLSDILNNISTGFSTVEEVINDIPFLPYQESERLASCLPKQLSFEKGSGIRMVVTFSDTIDASTASSNLYYTFQGISDDGTYYISAVFPLQSPELHWKNTADIDWDTFTGSDILPSLDELDYYISSIVIE